MYDIYDIAEKVIATRMALHFRLARRDSPSAQKYFVIGHPRSGTTSLHRFFLACGLNSVHKSGDWPTARADCFSDQGQNRPFRAYDKYYSDAQFILNCRPVANYLLSLEDVFKRDFSPRSFRHEIYRRSYHFDAVLAHFQGRANLVVLNIEKPGVMEFLARHYRLTPNADFSDHAHNRSRRQPSATNRTNIADALSQVNIDGRDPLLSTISSPLSSDFLQEMHADGRVHI